MIDKIFFGRKPAGKPSTITPKERKRTSNRWKRFEDWAYKQTGWKRKGHLLRGISCADLSNEIFSLDVTIAKFTKKLEQEMADAEYHKEATQTAVVWIAPEEGIDFRSGLAIMRLGDFIDLLVGGKKEK